MFFTSVACFLSPDLHFCSGHLRSSYILIPFPSHSLLSLFLPQDISVAMLEKYSMLYVSGRMRLDLNINILLIEMAQACVDALLIFGIPYYCSAAPGDVWGDNAYADGIWIFGTTVYTALVISMFGRIILLTHTWTVYSHCYFWVSILAYIIFLFLYQVTVMLTVA
jgi:hypothetical protein